jgi:hypothetical protein
MARQCKPNLRELDVRNINDLQNCRKGDSRTGASSCRGTPAAQNRQLQFRKALALLIQHCSSAADLESMLLTRRPKIVLQQHRSEGDIRQRLLQRGKLL